MGNKNPFGSKFVTLWSERPWNHHDDREGSGERSARHDPTAPGGGDPDEREPEDIAAATLRTTEAREEREEFRRLLAPVKQSLEAAGFYAYFTLDAESRWSVAVDDEIGRFDVRVGQTGYDVSLWMSSPGLFADEENAFRRRALVRLARITLPRIAKGQLEPHQSAEWDEVDEGVAVALRYDLPFYRASDIGEFIRGQLPDLEALLEFVESRVVE